MALITGDANNNALNGTIFADTISGLAGDDTLKGLGGNDIITGGLGNDLVQMGAGNDTFIWRTGDGSDRLTGQDGFDTLVTEFSGGADIITISRNNLSRVGVIEAFGDVLDLDDIERIYVRALAGADGIFINSLYGTDVTLVVVDLAGAPGSIDGAVDGVVRNGGGGNDIMNVALVNDTVSITGPTAVVMIGFADANDILELNGLTGNDTINASLLPANVMQLSINGDEGNDIITGSAGNDELDGGDGNDVVTGGRGNDTVDLGAGNDLFVWSTGHGDDTVAGGDGIDTLLITGTKGDDTFNISAFGGSTSVATSVNLVDIDSIERIRVRALAGGDTIYVRDLSGTDVSAVDIDLAAAALGTLPDASFDAVNIIGTTGNDLVEVAWSGTKIVVSGLPATVSVAHAGANDSILIAAGDGNDMIDGSGLPAGKALLHCSVTAGNDTVFGSVGNDRVTVQSLATALAFLDAGNDIFLGGDGRDVAHMGAGNDLLQGGAGNDVGFLGAGNDTMNGGAGNDLAYLGDGNDLYNYNYGSLGNDNDTVIGGNGIDTFNYRNNLASPSVDGISIEAEAGRVKISRVGAEVISLSAVERLQVLVGEGNDILYLQDLTGTSMKLVAIDLAATSGSVVGDGFVDSVSVAGTAGNDLITIGAIAGGLSITGLPAQVTITHADNGGPSDLLFVVGGDGNDTINATAMPAVMTPAFYGNNGNDRILGGAGAEEINGGDGNDTLSGGSNHDLLSGDAGNDFLDGGLGRDSLDGGTGNDVLVGGRGNDEITCGDGADRIRYTSVLDGHDVILDFDGDPTGGQDVLDLDALFDSLGIAASKRAALVNINDLGSTVEISVNVDGKAGFELLIATLNTVDVITKGQDVLVGT